MSSTLVATPLNTRPTLRFGSNAHAAADELLQTLEMREAVGGLSSMEMTFTDWGPAAHGQGVDFAFADGRILKLGTEVTAYAGSTAAPQEIFRGRISALECHAPQDGPPLISALAEDALQAARKTRRARVFDRSSPADIVRAIAAEHGLTPVLRDGLDQPVSDWTQMNQSDLAFLREVLERTDADLQVVGAELQAGPRSGPARNAVELRLHDNLLSVSVMADLANQPSEIRVSGYDPVAGESVAGHATDGRLGPGSGVTGPALVRRALGGTRAETIGHAEALTQGEADLLAKAVFQRRARQFVKVQGRAAGNPALRVGTHVTLERVSPIVAGTYIVTEAVHHFDQRTGYITRFCAESAYFGGQA
jgi:uncharacterized protein